MRPTFSVGAGCWRASDTNDVLERRLGGGHARPSGASVGRIASIPPGAATARSATPNR